VLGDAPADRYALGIQAALSDPNVGIVLVVLTPQTSTQIPETARVLGELSQKYKKPTFAAFMGDLAIRPATEILAEYSVPNYQVPERAVAAIAAMWRRRHWLGTPELNVEPLAVDRDRVQQILDQLRRDGRVTAGDAEARDILLAYGVPLPKSALARNADEAVAAATGDRLPGRHENRLARYPAQDRHRRRQAECRLRQRCARRFRLDRLPRHPPHARRHHAGAARCSRWSRAAKKSSSA